jgi:ornithine cyclodeaminase/alanine dehydrogenase-like protein (mu-crystallin family)
VRRAAAAAIATEWDAAASASTSTVVGSSLSAKLALAASAAVLAAPKSFWWRKVRICSALTGVGTDPAADGGADSRPTSVVGDAAAVTASLERCPTASAHFSGGEGGASSAAG